VTTGLGSIPAISHRAPTPILRSALVDEEPAAPPVVLTLLDPTTPRTGHQICGGYDDRLQQSEIVVLRPDTPDKLAGPPLDLTSTGGSAE
jgi:hypothetical protein